MEVINDYVTNIIFEENNDSNNWGNIIAILDCKGIITKKIFIKYLNNIIKNNDILYKNIVKKNNNNFLEVNKVDIQQQYMYKKCNYKLFDKKTYYVLNKKYETNWFFHLYTDYDNKKSRIYFTINHAYADGYKIISLLTTYNKQSQYKTPNFKRKNNNSYYIIIGTCILIFLYLKTLYNIYSKPSTNSINTNSINTNSINTNSINTNSTDFISIDFNYNKLKSISKKNNISLNDLLYSLTIKCHYHYFKTKQNILIASPFNTGNKNKTNNFFFLFTEIYNNLDTLNLFKKVNYIFNCYKFSAFVLIIGYIYNIIGNVICKQIYNKITDNLDILYTNMIGPEKKNFHDQYDNCILFNKKKITIDNVSFVMNHKKKEMIFNIISYNNTINVVISFPENIYNKKKLINAINCAYNDILFNDKNI